MKPAVLAVVVVLVATVGVVGWQFVSKSRAADAEVDKLVGSVEAVLRADELDSSTAQAAIREIVAHDRRAEDARLIRVHARLLLAMQRLQAAWDALGPLALSMEPSAEDLAIGSRILKRLHALRGETTLASQAADMAEGHHGATGDVGSLFLAWQCARRAGRGEDADRFSETLQSQHAGTPQGKLAAALAAETTTVSDLLALEIEFLRIAGPLDAALPPEEIGFAIAFLLLRDADKDGEKLNEAITRLQDVLRTFPSDVDTRSMMAFALHSSGDQAGRDAHLEWLLKNTPQDDARRDDWARMKGQPASKGP